MNKKYLIIISMFLISVLLVSCGNKQEPIKNNNEIQKNTQDKETEENVSPVTSTEETKTYNWCNPGSNDYGEIKFEIIGIIENYQIEGKTYTVCEEKVSNKEGVLTSHKWYTENRKILKEIMLDVDNKYATITNWINDNNQKCKRIQKEGVEEFLQCR